jgi:cytochrome c biogenesis protein CcmG/thiol:disulfide interchange protein DsbE
VSAESGVSAVGAEAEQPAGPGRGRSRRRRTVLWWAGGIALASICLVAVLATRPVAQDTVADSPLVGKPAPAIDAPGLSGGKVSLTSFRGRYVLVNFFASWCPPCQVEEPQLVEFAGQHRGVHGATVLGVVFSDSATNAAAFVRSNGVTWPVVTDPGGRVAITYGVTDPPESFLIAPDGRVVAAIDGGVTADGLDRILAEAEAEQP